MLVQVCSDNQEGFDYGGFAIIKNPVRVKFNWEDSGSEEVVDFNYHQGHLCYFHSQIEEAFRNGAYQRIENERPQKGIHSSEIVPSRGIRCRSMSNHFIPCSEIYNPKDTPFIYYDLEREELCFILLRQGEFEFLLDDFFIDTGHSLNGFLNQRLSFKKMAEIYYAFGINKPLDSFGFGELSAQYFELVDHIIGDKNWNPRKTFLEVALHRAS